LGKIKHVPNHQPDTNAISGLVVYPPLWKMMEWKSVGVMKFPIFMEKKSYSQFSKSNVPKHQPGDNTSIWSWQWKMVKSWCPHGVFHPPFHVFRPNPGSQRHVAWMGLSCSNTIHLEVIFHFRGMGLH
jgi:hypothetical protein